MQEDDELLYPTGPDHEDLKTEFSLSEKNPEGEMALSCGTDQKIDRDFTDDAFGNALSEDLVQSSEEDSTDESEQSLDLKEFSHALKQVEGQIIAAGDRPNAESSVIDFSEDKKKIGKSTQIEDHTGQGEDPADREYEDECPDLVDLSTLNREFRPFRYRLILMVE